MSEFAPIVAVPRRSRLFDGAVGIVGALIGVLAVVQLVIRAMDDEPQAAPLMSGGYLLAIPLIIFLSRYPLRIGQDRGTFEVGFEYCVLVFLAYVVDPWSALAGWAIAHCAGQFLIRKRVHAKIFNAGVSVLAGASALLVIWAIPESPTHGPLELLAVALGSAAFFAVDYVVTAVSIAYEERTPLARELDQPTAPVALAAFFAIASLGYVAALLVEQLPGWLVAVVVAVPLVTILVAVRAHSRGSEQARRLNVLLEGSTKVQELTEEPAIIDALVEVTRKLLREPQAVARVRPPGAGELGAPVLGAATPTWLVAPVAHRVGATPWDDQKALAAIVPHADLALDRLRLSAEMRRLAWRDPLTGLANRAIFLDRLNQAVRRQDRENGRLAVLFCDLDGFKRVNDLSGHVAGDELLIEVGARIRASVREVDTVARLGGDEFAVLLEGLTDAAEVRHACDRILAAVSAPVSLTSGEVSVTVTIGVSASHAAESADALLSQADMAMYHAKAQGKNRSETYRPDLGEHRRRRMELVEALRAAITAKELTLAYQTVHDLRSGQIYGIEALVRWQRDGVNVPPDLFLPAAEEGGLIVALGDLVLERFTAEMPQLRAAIGRRFTVGMNVSTQQLNADHFIAGVLAARELVTDVDLVLELTEQDLVSSDAGTLDGMTRLAEADVRFAVDGFGLGMTSVGYLHRLPIRILKMDRNFLNRIEDDAKACSLVRSMVVMGNALGMDVVAKGVERAGQVKHLVEHAGATIGQGYLFCEPLAVAEMTRFLAGQPSPLEWQPHPVDIGQSRLAEDHLLTALGASAGRG